MRYVEKQMIIYAVAALAVIGASDISTLRTNTASTLTPVFLSTIRRLEDHSMIVLSRI
jgi:hypothetical protein